MTTSAPLLTRKEVIKVALESPKGTKVAGTQALFVTDLKIDPTAEVAPRNGSGLYLTRMYPGVTGARGGMCSFTAELRGTGTSGMEAGLAILLQASGFKQTLEVYNTSSVHSDLKNVSIDVWQDGNKKGLAGASGEIVFKGVVGEVMFLDFVFTGIWQAVVPEALPANAPSTTLPLRLQSGTFTLATLPIKIQNFELDMGNNVISRPDLAAAGGIAYDMITAYEPTLKIDPEADLVGDYDFNGVWLAGTTAAVSLALTDGTDTITFTLPKVRYTEIPGGDRDGIRTYEIVAEVLDSTGDDAVAIAVT